MTDFNIVDVERAERDEAYNAGYVADRIDPSEVEEPLDYDAERFAEYVEDLLTTTIGGLAVDLTRWLGPLTAEQRWQVLLRWPGQAKQALLSVMADVVPPQPFVPTDEEPF